MKIAFANDHAGFGAREHLVSRIRVLGHEVVDFGSNSDKPVAYAVYAKPAIKALLAGQVDRAVLVCGSGVGMSVAANRYPGVRCALVTDLFAARVSRTHNDSNCLALRAREQSESLNDEILEIWFNTPFEGGRHIERIEKIETEAAGNCGCGAATPGAQ
ncbi:MAG: ribose 5-phosphate isomerase B [bacterium]|nr:ribose 5-phosphate isomerase B [Candidatus Sumerlaeota bacterium]